MMMANTNNNGSAGGSGGYGNNNHHNPSQPPQIPPSSKIGNNNQNSINSFIGGVSLPEHLYDAATSLQHARQDGFDYVVTALPDTRPPSSSSNRVDANASRMAIPSGSLRAGAPPPDNRRRTDVTRLESKWWSTSIVGMVSDPPHWKNNGGNQTSGQGADAPNDEGKKLLESITMTASDDACSKRKDEATKIFWGMMEWASHMNIPAVILPSVPLRENTGGGDAQRKKGNKLQQGVVPLNSSEEEDMFDGIHHPQTKRGRINRAPTAATVGSSGTVAVAASLGGAKGKAAGALAAPVAADVNNASAKEYARVISHLSTSSVCASSSHVQLWVRVPLTLNALQAFQLLLARCDHSPNVGCMVYISQRLDAADLPAVVRALHAFVGGGNVRAVSWDAKVFLRNKRGYPTLSKNHQFVFGLLLGRLGRTLRTLVEGRVVHPTVLQQQLSGGSYSNNNTSLRLHHLQYLRHLRSSRPSLSDRLDSEEAILETPYLDSLQSPLQPLGDHLEYQTYETFERDPVKYKRYGEAVAFALEDGMEGGRFAYLGSTQTTLRQLNRMSDAAALGGGFDLDVHDEEYYGDDNGDSPVEVDIYRATILVVGAGRGPLVREAIDAVSRVSVAGMNGAAAQGGGTRRALHARIVAVEKNPSAVLYLRSLQEGDPSWNGGHEYDGRQRGGGEDGGGNGEVVIPGTSSVMVVGCDMRDASSHPSLKHMINNEKYRADIVVSELLGSFGDNELSPECLDGVQRCGILKEGCVSIPKSYTAFIAPVSSARLHSEAKTQSCVPLNPNAGPASPPVGMQRAMETPYVVRSHAASQTHHERACWTFSHPRPSPAADATSPLPDSMDTSSDPSVGARSPSADAAGDAGNDRTVHLSFRHDPSRAAGIGCGYGAPDPEVAAVAAESPADPAPPGGTDTTATIHGFLGSFHSVLYEGGSGNGEEESGEERRPRSSVISIAPHSFSVGMFSWFPLFFPLKEPLRVPPGATVNCSIWRRSDDGRVWYEWCAEVVTATTTEHATDESTAGGGQSSLVIWATSSIHNPGGRSYHVNK